LPLKGRRKKENRTFEALGKVTFSPDGHAERHEESILFSELEILHQVQDGKNS
jgi:hypothetical protein